jgi:hypothetical protein
MTFLARLLSVLLIFASLVACEPPVVPVLAEDGGPSDLTDNAGQDGGGVELPGDAGSSTADGGPCDDGLSDAGATDAGPDPEVTVHLTGTAQAIRGSTLMVGTGQQPVLEAFVDAPSGVGPPEVLIEIAPVDPGGDAGAFQIHEVATATNDDAGMHYDLPWATASASEGLYVARAEATFGDAGFWSNPAYILVDRTAPAIKLTLDFDLDAGVQPRDFGAEATLVAFDDGGSGEVKVGLSMAGVQWSKPSMGFSLQQVAWVDLAPELPTVEGSRTTLESRVNAAKAVYDAWSTAADGWKITVRATATDLAGNMSSSEVDVPVTRELWQGVKVGSTGPVSLGAQGQILVNHGSSLDALSPDGALQSSTKLAALYGGALGALGRPATLVSPRAPAGETFVASSAGGADTRPYSQIASVGTLASGFQTFSPPGSLALAWALSASRGSIYVVPKDCGVVAVAALTGEAGDTSQKPYPNACSGVQLALGQSDLVATGPTIALISTLPSLEEVWAQPGLISSSVFPPVFLGNLAIFEEGSEFLVYDTHDLDLAQVADLASPEPANVVTSSQGDIYFLAPGALSKTDSNGLQLWTRKLKTGTKATGLVVGKGGDLIYAVDGSGEVSAYDSAGGYHWKSPAGTAEGDLMIDRCTGHAYAGITGAPVAMVLDSLGVDASPDAWPMGGHDVFQTYDSQGTADVDCAGHL